MPGVYDGEQAKALGDLVSNRSERPPLAFTLTRNSQRVLKLPVNVGTRTKGVLLVNLIKYDHKIETFPAQFVKAPRNVLTQIDSDLFHYLKGEWMYLLVTRSACAERLEVAGINTPKQRLGHRTMHRICGTKEQNSSLQI